MDSEKKLKRDKKINRVITVVSIIIPVVVACLFRVKLPNVEPLSFLPPIYATTNGITAVLLLIAVWAISKGKKDLHRLLMTNCVVFSLAFLIMYVAYHMTSDSTTFGGEGAVKYVYYFILITHIILSIVIIPLVLKTYTYAYLDNFKAHKKLAKFTFPIWLYVAVTGVIVYVMISPYYTH